MHVPQPAVTPADRTGQDTSATRGWRWPLAGLLMGPLLLTVPLTAAPVRAGSLSGTASLPRQFSVPRDAVFEAVLIDTALADAPARELGRVRLQPAGPSPWRFTIPYREAELPPWGRYAVRASVHQGKRLLFTTDTFNPAFGEGASQPLRLVLVLVPVKTGARP